MKRIIISAFFFFFLGGVALAQDPAPKKSNEGWEQVNGDMMQPGESIPASRLVGAAYGFIFAAVVFWVFTVARRARPLFPSARRRRRAQRARRG
jgi:hypothetical protein